MNPLLRCLLALALLAPVLAACGGTDKVKKEDIAKKAQAEFDKIAQRGGQASFPKITCPEDLEAKAGETTRCEATGTDGTLGITVTVKSVKDGKVQLGFKGDDKLEK